MELVLIVLLRPLLYLALYGGCVYWVMRAMWFLMPPSRLKTLLFRRW